MKERIAEAVKNSNTLTEVRDSLFEVFRSYRQEGHSRIGYVSGIITSEGRENIGRNIERLTKYTERLRTENDFPIFSATDVFDNALFARLDAAGFKNEDWIVFWQEVLGNKERFVTEMFMTPKWQKSSGATDEYATAQKVNMIITYIDYKI